MIGPRRAIFLGLLALSVLWPLSSVRADQAFQRFLPLLVDLDGWQGKKPDGMSMEMSNMSMTSATRDYQRGAAQVHAGVVIRPGGCRSPGAAPGRDERADQRRSHDHVDHARLAGYQDFQHAAEVRRFWWRSARKRCSVFPTMASLRTKR